MGLNNQLLAGYLAVRGQQRDEAEWQRQQVMDAAQEAYRQAMLQHGLDDLSLQRERFAYERSPENIDNQYRQALIDDLAKRRASEEARGQREDAKLKQGEDKERWDRFMDMYSRSRTSLGVAYAGAYPGQAPPDAMVDEIVRQNIAQALQEANLPVPESVRQATGAGAQAGLQALGVPQGLAGAMGTAARGATTSGVPKSQAQLREEALALPSPAFALQLREERRKEEADRARAERMAALTQIEQQKAQAYVQHLADGTDLARATLQFRQQQATITNAFKRDELRIKDVLKQVAQQNANTASFRAQTAASQGQQRINQGKERIALARKSQQLRERLDPHWKTVVTTKAQLDRHIAKLDGEVDKWNKAIAEFRAKDPELHADDLVAANARLQAVQTEKNALMNSDIYRAINGYKDAGIYQPGLYEQYVGFMGARNTGDRQSTNAAGKVTSSNKYLTPELRIHFLQAASGSSDPNVWRRPDTQAKAAELARRSGFRVE